MKITWVAKGSVDLRVPLYIYALRLHLFVFFCKLLRSLDNRYLCIPISIYIFIYVCIYLFICAFTDLIHSHTHACLLLKVASAQNDNRHESKLFVKNKKNTWGITNPGRKYTRSQLRLTSSPEKAEEAERSLLAWVLECQFVGSFVWAECWESCSRRHELYLSMEEWSAHPWR